MHRGVLVEEAPARGGAHRAALVLTDVAHVAEDILRRACDQDLAARLEDRREARPWVADDRRAASGSLEEPHARRPPRRDHRLARDVEREALRSVEVRVLARIDV